MSGSPLLAASALVTLALSSAPLATAAEATSPPRGPVIEFAGPPTGGSSWAQACSFRRPVCVRASPGTSPAFGLAALSAAERTWDVLEGALSLPPPETDLDGTWPVYLVDEDVPGYGRAVLGACDPRARYDRCGSFALIDRTTPPGCALDLALARAWTRASLFGGAPATDEASALAQGETLSHLAVPCADPWDDRLEFQSHPERTLADPSSEAFARGASLFYGWLDETFGREPGALLLGLWALAPTRTPAGAWRWSATPNGYDVLRASLKGALFTNSTIEDVFVEFAVDRAQAQPPARVAWHIPWPGQARRLASPEPVSPTGASYLLIDHAGAPPSAKLRVEAQWEDYGRMRWVVLKLDERGRATATMPVTSLDRATRASLTIEGLDGVDRLLVVGVDVGSTEHPFDPDQGEWEPHGWLVTLEGQ
jgi:hypothetical protein